MTLQRNDLNKLVNLNDFLNSGLKFPKFIQFQFQSNLFGPFIITWLYYREDLKLLNCFIQLGLMPIRLSRLSVIMLHGIQILV